ncbi:hypothetical protein Tco_1373647 [Tanacetum coccineum]
MIWLSLHATLHFSSLQMFQKSTCISSRILFTNMTLSIDSRWTKGRDSNSIWKSLEISSRSVVEYRVKTLMHFLLMKKMCLSYEILVTPGKSIHSMMLLLIRCINLGERLLISLTGVYLERHLLLTSFVSLEHKSFRRNKIGMPTSKDDYLINTLRFVSVKEETQIYDAILPDSLTSPEMKETKAYKTYLGFATGVTLSKKARKVKRPAKKTTKAPERGVVIRETPEIPLSKKKEKVDVTQGKGIELLSQVALTEDAQFEEFQKKSMRDFHKTHPSRSGTVTKTVPSAANIKPSITSEGTGVKPGVPDMTEEESSESEAES